MQNHYVQRFIAIAFIVWKLKSNLSKQFVDQKYFVLFTSSKRYSLQELQELQEHFNFKTENLEYLHSYSTWTHTLVQ